MVNQELWTFLSENRFRLEMSPDLENSGPASTLYGRRAFFANISEISDP
jgi:hypothetical protein